MVKHLSLEMSNNDIKFEFWENWLDWLILQG